MIKCEKDRKTFPTLQKMEKNILWFRDVYGCNNGNSDIHGKEFPKQSLFHCKYHGSHTQTNVRHNFDVDVRKRWDLRIGNNWLGESLWRYLSLIGDERIINLQRTKEALRLLGFCVASWEDFTKSWIKRSMGAKIRMDHFCSKLHKLTESMESRRNSNGTSSKDLIRCSSTTKSKVYWAD